jgi:hypothetical protein
MGLCKMNIKNSKYAYKVTLQKKKDESQRFCGDYRPITCKLKMIHYLMPLVDDGWL